MEGDIRKKGNWRKSRWLFLLFLATGYWLLATDVHAGQATANNYFYKLALGDKGQPQVDLVNAALDRADAELAILAAGGSLSATAPLTYNSSTGVIALPQAGASASGYLASADWSAFNAKQAALPSGTSSQYLRGDLTMQTLNQAAVAGLTSASAPNFAGIKIGAYSIDTAVAAVTAATTGGGDPVVSFYNAGGTRIAFIDNFGAYYGPVLSSGDPATQSGSCFIGMGMYRQNPALGMSFMFGESLATGNAGFTIAPILGTISTSNNIFRICLDSAFTEPVMLVDGNGALHLGKYGAGFLVSDASGNITATTTPALGTPASGTLTNCTFPTLNQNTTGTAAGAALWGLYGTIAGPTAARTYTFPNAAATMLYSGGALGTPSGGTLTNCTFPTLNQNTTGTAAGLSGTQTQNYIYGGPASGGNGSALFRAMVALDIPGPGGRGHQPDPQLLGGHQRLHHPDRAAGLHPDPGPDREHHHFRGAIRPEPLFAHPHLRLQHLHLDL